MSAPEGLAGESLLSCIHTLQRLDSVNCKEDNDGRGGEAGQSPTRFPNRELEYSFVLVVNEALLFVALLLAFPRVLTGVVLSTLRAWESAWSCIPPRKFLETVQAVNIA